jgi:hypothetical protein
MGKNVGGYGLSICYGNMPKNGIGSSPQFVDNGMFMMGLWQIGAIPMALFLY